MGQSCVPHVCEQVPHLTAREQYPGQHHQYQHHGGLPTRDLTTEEASRRIEALCLELRMLKDDNYRIREEQIELERGMTEAGIQLPSAGGGGGFGSGPGRPAHWADQAPPAGAAGGGQPPLEGSQQQQRQLGQLHDAIRSLQEENRTLREARSHGVSDASTDAGPDDVSEEEYRSLQDRLAKLQQSHLRQLQEARQLKSRQTGSAPTSGMSTPYSTAGGFGGMAFGLQCTGQDMRVLQAQYQALMHEQEVLRGKVRKLAHSA